MNERIKELAEQCHHLYSTHHIDLDKFTELIIQECADVCFNKYVNSDQMSKQCGINFAKDIKEHFGVEE